MNASHATVFDCQGASLAGIAEIPPKPRQTALLVVTGGPQYRVGSHRQFTLLCRSLAEHGFASLRFDFRGSGDSHGDRATFTELQADITAAMNQLCRLVPRTSRIVMLGLCDGASAILMNAHLDSRVTGVVLLNPWVRTSGSLEKARVQGYYPTRLLRPTFWWRLLTGKVRVWQSIKSFRQHLAIATDHSIDDTQKNNFLQKMYQGAERFRGQCLVVLSGQDMTAQEYRDLLVASTSWRRQMTAPNVKQVEIADANHTFSSAVWRKAVTRHCLEFIQRLDSSDN